MRFAFLLMRNGWHRSKMKNCLRNFSSRSFNFATTLSPYQVISKVCGVVFLGSEWAHKNATHSHLAITGTAIGRNAV